MLPASKEDPRSGLRPLWAEVWVVGMLVDPAYVALGWVSIRVPTATRGCRSGFRPPWWGTGRVVRLGWRPGWSIRGPTTTRGRRSGVRPPWWGTGRVVRLGWRPWWSIRGPTATRGRRSGDRPPWWGTGRVVRLGRGQGGRSGGRPPPEGVDPGIDRLGGERDGWSAWAGARVVDPGADRHQRASIRGSTALVGNGTGGPPGPGPGWSIRGPTTTRGRRSGGRPPWDGVRWVSIPGESGWWIESR